MDPLGLPLALPLGEALPGEADALPLGLADPGLADGLPDGDPDPDGLELGELDGLDEAPVVCSSAPISHVAPLRASPSKSVARTFASLAGPIP